MMSSCTSLFFFFFFNDTATTEIYTLSYTTLFRSRLAQEAFARLLQLRQEGKVAAELMQMGTLEQLLEHGKNYRKRLETLQQDRKSTRLNSSHQIISYAVFCLKKKNRLQHADSRHP